MGSVVDDAILDPCSAKMPQPARLFACIYLVWLGAFVHAGLRSGRAWIEQCWTLAGLAAAAVALNWITTGDHPARSLAHSHLWAVAGMDLLLLAGAAIAGLTALGLQRRGTTPPSRQRYR